MWTVHVRHVMVHVRRKKAKKRLKDHVRACFRSTQALVHEHSYEPAGLTVHPPPKRSRVDSFFSHRCLVPPKFFPQEKVDFVGDIRNGTHKNVVLPHNHSNPISTKS